MRPSNSDGCTMPGFLNRVMKAEELRSCCEKHDFNRRDANIPNRIADRKLRQCIISKGYFIRAWIYWIFVRLASPFYSN